MPSGELLSSHNSISIGFCVGDGFGLTRTVKVVVLKHPVLASTTRT